MAAPEEPGAAAEPNAAEGSDRREAPAPKRRNPWIWVSVVSALAAAGFLVWALALRSDLDASKQDNKDLQAQIEKGKETGGTVVTEAKALYQDLAQQVGSTSEDLAATEQDLARGKKIVATAAAAAGVAAAAAVKAGNDADEADKKAQQADKEAQQAGTETDKAKAETKQATAEADKAKAETDQAKAETDQAKAEAQAADSKAAIAADCAKAYVSAFGSLFQGESVKDQAPAVREQLSAITADCKAAFNGT